MKKETREKILGFGLVGILASVPVGGMALSCAGSLPVYSQRDIVQEIPDGNFYREVTSDAEKLKLSFYEEELDGTRGLEISLTRYEPSNSAECLKKDVSVKVYVDMSQQERTPSTAIIPSDFKGFVDVRMTDEYCDGHVDSASVSYGCTTAELSSFGNQYDNMFSGTEDSLSTIFGNIPYQIELWHERKGL